ncbi:hypothetical protein SUGI_1003830 [Cryptomeria japonica]|nr:hypothetical protein SUGI_1003810 [Cryptomeria japonica]GLJ47533.1 hypothetical protein SUGI_1003830 [Cryptomeria japonica]
MRQVGVLCAAGLVALDELVGRLPNDHRNCRILAENLNKIKGLHVKLDAVETNIVFVDVTADSALDAEELCEAVKDKGVIIFPENNTRFRIVTHHQILEDDVRYVISCFQEILLCSETSSNIA